MKLPPFHHLSTEGKQISALLYLCYTRDNNILNALVPGLNPVKPGLMCTQMGSNQVSGARSRTRTGTDLSVLGILSPVCLPNSTIRAVKKRIAQNSPPISIKDG